MYLFNFYAGEDSMLREMQVAGLFYEANKKQLEKNMQEYFGKRQKEQAEEQSEKVPVRICMLPHAGHIYSGRVTAETLAKITLPHKLIILCPNHTGLGKHGAVWDTGAFQTPLGDVPIAGDIAAELLKTPCFCRDYLAHQREHSIEVILPFLQYLMGQHLEIVPISLASLKNLPEMAQAITKCMQENADIGLVISSDMNHFAAEKENKRRDFMALDAMKNMDENKLLQVVMENDISMCGVLGAYIGLVTAKALGLQHCELVSYDTSASTSGDKNRVVGYAGLYFE